MKIKRFIFLLAGLIMIGTGCSGGDSGEAEPTVQQNNEPVTLTLYQRSAGISDEEFQTLIAEPVKKKYPYISLELVRASKEVTPKSLVSSGNIPDLVFASPGAFREFKELDAVEDLTSLVKAHRFDLGRLEPYVLETVKAYGEDPNKLLAFPFSVNFSALYYNKDIFDKFGVPYPKDGMTWEEVTALAKTLTRTDNGQQYFGLHPAGIDKLVGELGLSAYDPKTQKATLTGDKWNRVFQAYKAVYDIPGNKPGNNVTAFMKDRNLAMMAAMGARLGELEILHSQGNPVNWDWVSFPAFQEAPKTAAETELHLLLITSTSKHKEEAFKVLEVISEDANQAAMNKRGRLTTLKDPGIKEGFGSDLQTLKGKNVKGIFSSTPAVSRYNDKYSDIAKSQVAPAMDKVIKGETDINTALREAEDAANKLIEAELKN